LISSYSFYPTVGGTEIVSNVLAAEFVRMGHDVKLVTQTGAKDDRRFAYEVVRRPTPLRLFRLVRWADVYFQNHVSLLMAWPLLLPRRAWVVTQQIWLPKAGMTGAWKGVLKRWLLRLAVRVSISDAMGQDLHGAPLVIGNPYDAHVFRAIPQVKRDRDIVFVGRLVFAKGAHLALEALAHLKQEGSVYSLTVVGGGPEEESLRLLARRLQLEEQVTFAGVQAGSQLAQTLNAHRALVVPSLWEEPFGVVALEGCACGCVVIGSDVGGLPEALGPCGLIFPRGDVGALATRIREVCSDPRLPVGPCEASAAHLAKHGPEAVAAAYLRVFESAIGAHVSR
jgi:glycosyltransferase involved in cell wall biosynthesis